MVARGASLNWDPSGNPAAPGGTGSWDTSSLFWDDNGTLPNVAWSDTTGVNTASFGGIGGLVHLTSPTITANALTFNAGGYTVDNNGISGNTLKLAAAGAAPAPVITVTNAADSVLISAQIGGTAATVTKSGAGAP